MKESLGRYIGEYTSQLRSGNISKGYKGLMEYLMGLRTHFANKYPTELRIGRFYQGYMDMSYFSIVPTSLESRKLKIALLFNHEKIRFEVWLVGQNKQVQQRHWDWLNGVEGYKYPISKTAQHSIVEHTLVAQPDFNQMAALTKQIEAEALEFIKDITEVFS